MDRNVHGQKEKTLRRGGKNTQKNYTKKIFMTQITRMVDHPPRARHPGMWNQVGLKSITTNKASGGGGIPIELFQILKDDAVKVLHSIRQQIWKTQLWPQDWKGSVFIPISKKGNAKECPNYRTTVLISYDSKVMFKILHARLQQYVNRELPDIQAGFRKGRGTRDQVANIHWIIEEAREL